MTEQYSELGKLQSIHGVSLAYTQRTIVVAGLSFIFFLGMLVMFSYRQNIGYFLLGTAFLIVEIFTLLAWYLGRKREVRVYENGFTYRERTVKWDEISSVESSKQRHLVNTSTGSSVVLTENLHNVAALIGLIKSKVKHAA